jgi:arylsulfatase A-like enzyme
MSNPKYPNVIFIIADQMKWSALRMYSDIGIETPSLERLASDGVRFEVGITPHALCVPARVAMMTSRFAHSTGARRNETLMPPGELHAFRIWKELGYTTGLIGKNHCFIQQSDLATLDVRCEISHSGLSRHNYLGEIPSLQGMDWTVPENLIHESHSTRNTMTGGSGAGAFAVTDHPLEGYSSNVIATQVEAFLERAVAGDTFDGTGGEGKQKNPFAIQVSFPDPHAPNEVPRKYAEMVPPSSIKLPPTREDEFELPNVPERNRVLYEMLNLDGKSEGDVRNIVSTYLAMTRFVDDGIGRILDKLDSLGIRDNTIIVFTADHGDFAGEHNMFGKGGVYYDSLVRVPYIVSWPGGGVPSNAVDDSPVSTIDLLPTILQLSGVADFSDSPTQEDGQDLPPAGPRLLVKTDSEVVTTETLRRLQGKLLPTVTNAVPRTAAFSEYGTGGPPFTMEMLDQLPQRFGSPAIMDSLWAREAEGRRKMVRTRDWKYVTDLSTNTTGKSLGESTAHSDDELYDLVSDPWELTNVAHEPERVGVISDMRALLVDWMLETEDYNPVPLPTLIGRGPKPEIDTTL